MAQEAKALADVLEVSGEELRNSQALSRPFLRSLLNCKRFARAASAAGAAPGQERRKEGFAKKGEEGQRGSGGGGVGEGEVGEGEGGPTKRRGGGRWHHKIWNSGWGGRPYPGLLVPDASRQEAEANYSERLPKERGMRHDSLLNAKPPSHDVARTREVQ